MGMDSADRSPRPDLAASAPRRTPWAILLGVASLLWVLCRVLRKPSRLAYPCQQAALLNVSLLLGIPAIHLVRRTLAARRSGLGLAGAALVASLAFVAVTTDLSDPRLALSATRSGEGSLSAPRGYVAVLHLVESAGGPSGLHHLGVDELLACMGVDGSKFYRSPVVRPESGPDGIVGADDVVLVKVNSQWPERGGTNTDVLKGVIARVLEHPDGFTGEVVVVENTQAMGTLDWAQANAEDHSQSAIDVVNLFTGLGEPVSAYLWDTIRTVSVTEYDLGDLRDGYVVGPYESDVQMRISYPKFRTAHGEYVSLKYGLWDPGSGTYDDSRLTFLNIPVLKCHGAVYGVTAATKHHVGTMTTSLSTSTHSGVRWGGLGKFLARVRRPDLNILDAIYILARPSAGPWCTYAEATRTDMLLAGTDPIALDWWATKNILVPTIQANGYTSWPMQDPDNPSSIFRLYLDAATQQLLAAGIPVTHDPAQIQVRSCGALDAGPLPTSALDARAFPNPTRSGATLLFAAPGGSASVPVVIHDVAGRRLRTLSAAPQSTGGCEAFWDGRDDSGRTCPPGTYYWRARGAGVDASGKITLVH